MISTIEVAVRDEAERLAIERALREDDVRAFVVIVGALMPFSKPVQAAMLNLAAVISEENRTSDHVRP